VTRNYKKNLVKFICIWSVSSSGTHLNAQQFSIPPGARQPTKWIEMMGVWQTVTDEQDTYSKTTYKQLLTLKDLGESCTTLEIRTVTTESGEVDVNKREPICSRPIPDFYTSADRYVRSLSWVKDNLSEMASILYRPYFDAKFWKAADWFEIVGLNIQCPNGKTSEIAKNKLRTVEYASLYKTNPGIYKWSGMAAFASDTVGLGMRLADFFADKPLIKATMQDFLSFLSEGNRAVYNDIYWQHEAYRIGGIEEIRKQHALKRVTRDQADAWEQIDYGRRQGNQTMIWEGNAMLLRFEQETTLQPIYERYSDLGTMMSPFMYSPIPNNPTDVFQRIVPFGNIGIFDDRWKWIDKSMLPSWKSLSDGTSQALDEINSLLESNNGACKNEN
jgi:hypothetical protein